MLYYKSITVIYLLVNTFLLGTNGGVLKDLYQKITNTNNKTEELVKQSAPICGSDIFSTADENTLSPEIIFITNRVAENNNQQQNDRYGQNSRKRNNEINEVANEFRFHVENVTLDELKRNGFNPDAPVTFLMHGFTSGYPLQAWISAIVESYTIDRESNGDSNREYSSSSSSSSSNGGGYTNYGYERRESYQRSSSSSSANNNRGRSSSTNNKHNLFIINWHYAARGILYPRAVANIPIVASYATKFINEKLIEEAGINPRRIQLIGHSLGAHLAGFIGKNTQSKLGRIYGLDPAGPCFGAITGKLYPASKRLAPSDAEEVITIHTNGALLGIDKPLGKYSVFVEGGLNQPGCKGGGVLKSLQAVTFDGGDFDTVACSHSRAPNLLTYRHDQSDSQNDCQLIAYECKDWDSFSAGQCGVCHTDERSTSSSSSFDNIDDESATSRRRKPEGGESLESVECKRIGLDWQYPANNNNGNNNNKSTSTRRPTGDTGSSSYSDSSNSYNRSSSTYKPNYMSGESNYDDQNNNNNNNNDRTTSRRPNYSRNTSTTTSTYDNQQPSRGTSSTRRPSFDYSSNNNNDNQRNRREAKKTNTTTERSRSDSKDDQDEESVKAKNMFLKTGDTQPYCVYQYQVVLELNEPFPEGKPAMSLVLQDSEPEQTGRRNLRRDQEQDQQNSLTNDEFGNKFNERTYTHLLTSGRKLKKIDHATLLIKSGGELAGHRLLKSLKINYMSHSDPKVRQKFSTHLCPMRRQQLDVNTPSTSLARNRYYFKPCEEIRN